MKVKIGNYISWFGPHQLVDKLKFLGLSDKAEERLKDALSDSFVGKFLNWNHKRQKRKVKVKIDYYDTWSVYNTLALITLPLLKEYNEIKHGAGFIDDEDVPEELKSTNAPEVEEWQTDDNHFKRYQYVLDEMIFAFESIVDDSWEDQFHTGNLEFEFVPTDDTEEFFEMVKGPNDTHHFDREGHAKYQARIDNGLRLFGKYYMTLWD